MGLIKLKILRRILLLTISFLLKIKGPKWRLNLPLTWLRHYLSGKGTPMEVPQWCLREAHEVFARVLHDPRAQRPLKSKKTVYGSWLYEGRGFENRPTLFYLIGGFTFNVSHRHNGAVFISGIDKYDWHADANGNYFSSSLGELKIPLWMIKLAGKIFGEDLFVLEGWPMGNPGISNKLWDLMHQVGAKPFITHFEGWVDLDSSFKITKHKFRKPRSAKTAERRAREYKG